MPSDPQRPPPSELQDAHAVATTSRGKSSSSEPRKESRPAATALDHPFKGLRESLPDLVDQPPEIGRGTSSTTTAWDSDYEDDAMMGRNDIATMVNRILSLVEIPNRQRHHRNELVGLWSSLQEHQWNAVSDQDVDTRYSAWPEYLSFIFGSQINVVLKAVYGSYYSNMVKRDWKALVRFGRATELLGLPRHQVILRLGPDVATSANALKVICKLLENPRRATFTPDVVMTALTAAMVKRCAKLPISQVPKLTCDDVFMAAKELRRGHKLAIIQANSAQGHEADMSLPDMARLTLCDVPDSPLPDKSRLTSTDKKNISLPDIGSLTLNG
ncbi:hypothetical protein CkaCkLH20_13033 [Colletotrichum karsti]|uniref:Uncharacterized protein n=1 Tax=Colletotrichum karsti TaxID=1095194 RepID=A0A9P6HT96_9PEZI|nr:uncharacterized protein CkaCkLH20_13033 [Colletotrichum karsti]KAF9869495.1 hypothetical protein CkaCkLH20_13033 [Colletotrichum karsti]